jgi:FlaA1/EpsC-like NDP-sugar epimerase
MHSFRLRHLVAGASQYGRTFIAEALLFYVTLVFFELADDRILPGSLRQVLLGLVIVTVAMAVAEARFRLYRRVWAVASLNDAIAAVLAVVMATALVALMNLLIQEPSRPFHTLTPILAAPAVGAVICGLRLLPRLRSTAPRADNRLLVVVTDSSAYAALKALLQDPNPRWSPVAIVTESQTEQNRTVLGIPVVGHTADLAHWLEVTQADGVAFVLNGHSPAGLRTHFSVCLAAELPIFIVPGPDEWLQNRKRLRELAADDLVGRTPRPMEVEHAGRLVAGRTVMVTGAAGSIGSELCRVLATLQPERLVLVDNNESGLFDISEELRMAGTVEVKEALVSIVDHDALLGVFADERPEVVFHAAAYKHVPLLEAHPDQAVRVNLVGTRNAMRCAEATGAESFILISSDKAVARHSVLGCTKRLCELMVLGYEGPMTCWAVRFGNVVGSRGSVVPTFERQIREGGPVTITHPDVARYLMTSREAVSLVITTLELARPGHLYMLDMGDPIKILTLAQALIRSRGLRPGSDIEIVFTGLRPGEILSEELLAKDEGWRSTTHPSIREVISPPNVERADLEWTIERLLDLAREGRRDELSRALRQAVVLPRDVQGEPQTQRQKRARTEA